MKPQNQTIEASGPKYIQVLKDLPEEEAVQLHPSLEASVAAIIYGVRFNVQKGTTEMLIITEEQDFGKPTMVTKYPGETMNYEDTDIYAAGHRGVYNETGHAADKMLFAMSVKCTSSDKGYLWHYKAFFVAHDIVKVGKPTEASVKSVDWVELREIVKHPSKYMTFDQRIGLRAAKEIMKTKLGYEIGLDVANIEMPEVVRQKPLTLS